MFSKISIIISLLCGVYLVGLGLFVLVRAIVLKRRAKKSIKEEELKVIDISSEDKESEDTH